MAPEITVQTADLGDLARADEALMIAGFGYREAACLVNEQRSATYTIYGRCQLAADTRDPRELAALLARLDAADR